MKYRVVDAGSGDELAELVDILLGGGWILHGDLKIVRGSIPSLTTFYQAMTFDPVLPWMKHAKISFSPQDVVYGQDRTYPENFTTVEGEPTLGVGYDPGLSDIIEDKIKHALESSFPGVSNFGFADEEE